MDMSMVHNVKDKNRPKIKKEPVELAEIDNSLALSSVPDGVLHIENVKGYLGCKFETLGDADFSDDYRKLYNQDILVKPAYGHLENNEIIKYSMKYEFNDEECTKIILSKIHNGKFWMEDRVIDITADLIHDVTGLSKVGEIPLNEKNMRNIVLDNTGSSYNGRGIAISKIKQDDVRYLCKILTTKFYGSSREDDMAIGMVHVAYLMCIEKK